MTIHEMDDKEFLKHVVGKPLDELSALEEGRLLGILANLARREALLLDVLRIVEEQLRDVAQDPVRLERAQEFAKMKIEELFR